jgi:hypothetical protein
MPRLSSNTYFCTDRDRPHFHQFKLFSNSYHQPIQLAQASIDGYVQRFLETTFLTPSVLVKERSDRPKTAEFPMYLP